MSNKPKNCSKVKNACKYCLQQVTNKTGLQCQGACKKWAHFNCLNYTPGKISDIKAGIIKVMCPCPDCETTQAKEYVTNPPYSCSNHICPANAKGPIRCESDDCPSNRKKQFDNRQCATKACPMDAKDFQRPAKQTSCLSPDVGTSSVCSPQPRSCMSPAPKPRPQPVRKVAPRAIPSHSSSSCQNQECKNSNTSSVNGEEKIPKAQAAMVDALQEMCGTVGKLSIQITELIGKINKLM